jgi:hypothetical protein
MSSSMTQVRRTSFVSLDHHPDSVSLQNLPTHKRLVWIPIRNCSQFTLENYEHDEEFNSQDFDILVEDKITTW